MSYKIKILAMDVDGTMTDGSINISEKGEIFKTFNVKDGMGIKMLQSGGIIPVIITGRISEIVACRTKELGITEVFQGISDKKEVLKGLCSKYSLVPEQLAYIGDDVNDIEAMEYSGLSFSPSDAVDEVKSVSKVVLEKCGGKGAVRECADYLLKNGFL